MGTVLEETELKVVHTETLETLPIGQVGEVFFSFLFSTSFLKRLFCSCGVEVLDNLKDI